MRPSVPNCCCFMRPSVPILLPNLTNFMRPSVPKSRTLYNTTRPSMRLIDNAMDYKSYYTLHIFNKEKYRKPVVD